MKAIKTQTLYGAALDWAVAHVERKFNQGSWEDFRLIDGKIHLHYCGAVLNAAYDPSTDWAQGGTIIEREKITTAFDHEYYEKRWVAEVLTAKGDDLHEAFGPTLLIAAMRCYVLSDLGTEVDIPEEFV